MYPDITKKGIASIRIVLRPETPNAYLPDTAWEPCETTNPGSVMRAIIHINNIPISLYAVEIVERNGCPDATSHLGAALFSKIPYRTDYSHMEINGKRYLPIACPFSVNQV